MDLNEHLNDQVAKLSGGHDAAEMASYAIWGAAATATRAFENVTLKVDPYTQRIFVGVSLRWWARSKRFGALHKAWLDRAERRCLTQIPEGYKLLVYYVGGDK